MKRFLILLALISAPVFSAENWDRTQLNLKLQKNDWSIKYREYVTGLDSDGEVDKFHWQMSYKYDNWRFDYQYWEKDGKVELRPRFQVKLFKQENGFYFRPRVEQRDRRGKEEYFRVWTTLGWDGNYSCNSALLCVAPAIQFSPRFAFDKDHKKGGGTDNGKLEDIQMRFQVKIKPNGSKKITIKPGFWYVMDNDYNTKNLYATFQLDVKF